MPTLTNRDIASRIRMTIYQDTAQSTGRGSPNAISPASDTNNYTLAGANQPGWTMTGTPPTQEVQYTGSSSNAYAVLGSNTLNVEILARVSVSNTGDNAGVVLRYINVNNHYRFRFTSTTFSIVVMNAGTPTTLVSQSFSLSANTFYWIKARSVGALLLGKIWADGAAEPTSYGVQTADTSQAVGQAGYYVSLNSNAHTAQFDHLAIYHAIFMQRDIGTRFRLQSQPQPRDISSRFRVQAVSPRDIGSRFLLQSTTMRDLASRFRLQVVSPRDIASRFRLLATANRDISTRFRLKLLAVRDLASRFRLQVLSPRDIGTRFRLGLVSVRDLSSRFRLQALSPRDIASRFILGFLAPRDLASRFRMALYQDTAQTGLRGSPNNISPASDSENYTLAAGVGGTWSYLSGPPGEIQFTGSTNPAYALLGTHTLGDIDTSVRVSPSAGGDGVGVVLRYNGTNSHYRIRYQSSAFAILINNNGTTTLTTTPFTVTAGTFYWIRAKAVGKYLMGKIWADGGVEPTAWMVVAIDTTFSSGQFGLFANLGVSTRNGQFDNFSVANGTGLALRDIASRFLLKAVASRDLASRFRLQSQPNLRDIGSRLRIQAISPRDIATRFRLGGPPQRDIFSRFRLQSPPILRDIGVRFRLKVVSPRDLASRFRLKSFTLRDLFSRFRLQVISPRDLPTRFRLQGFVSQSLRDLATRFVLVAPPPPPVVILPALSIPFAEGGSVLPISPPTPTSYAVNGTVLATQPYLCTAPMYETQGVIPAGASFLLFFSNPDSGTQTLLSSGGTNAVPFTFYLASGQQVTATRVRLTVTNIGTIYQVVAILVAPLTINNWVVQTQFL